MSLTIIALPGLHGTAALFDSFIQARPDGVQVVTVEYPLNQPLSYVDLEDFVLERIPTTKPFALVAESFSGPVALRVAARSSPKFVALCASFVRSPVPSAAALLPWNAIFGSGSSISAIAWALTGGDRNLARAVAREITRVAPDVLAHRVRSVLRLDDVAVLERVTAPLVYVRATRDRLVRRRVAQQFKSHRADVELAEIDAPHMVLQTAPTAAWTALEANLAAR